MSNINDTCNWQQCTENPLPWFWGNICPWLLKLLKAILSCALVTEGSSWRFKHLTNVVWLNKMDRIQCKPTIVPWYNWPPCWIGCIYVIYGATKCNYAETAVQHNFSFSLTNCNWPTGFHGYIKTRSKIALNSARSLRTKSRVKELPVDRSGQLGNHQAPVHEIPMDCPKTKNTTHIWSFCVYCATITIIVTVHRLTGTLFRLTGLPK